MFAPKTGTTGGSICALLVSAALTLPLAGCGDQSQAQPDGQTTALAAPARPTINVVMFLIDTLRADKLGCYGYDKPTSPTIDALARDGVLFTRAQAPAPWTCPSIPSIFTSTFLCEHGITSELKRLSPQIRTVAERFKQIDYHTASFYVNIFAGPTTGMDRGFDIAEENPNRRHYIDGEVIDGWAARRPADKPFFLYVHNIEPHNPFNAPPHLVQQFGDSDVARAQRLIGRLLSAYRPMLRPDWDNQRGPIRPLGTTDHEPQLQQIVAQLDRLLPQHHALYDAVVRHADERLSSVIDSLKKAGVWDDTLLIVLSDHGEELSERGDYLHSQSVYGELTNVPLIIKFPGNQYAGTRVDEVVTLVDVLPTVFDYLGRPELSQGARGRSLMPLVRGEPQDEAGLFVVTTVRENEKKWRKAWAARGNVNVAVQTRDGAWKGIWNVQNDTFELYNLRADRDERFNQCAAQPELAGQMMSYLRRWWDECGSGAAAPGTHQPTPEELARLTALGYAGEHENIESADEMLAELPEAVTTIVEQPHEPCPVPDDD